MHYYPAVAKHAFIGVCRVDTEPAYNIVIDRDRVAVSSGCFCTMYNECAMSASDRPYK